MNKAENNNKRARHSRDEKKDREGDTAIEYTRDESNFYVFV